MQTFPSVARVKILLQGYAYVKKTCKLIPYLRNRNSSRVGVRIQAATDLVAKTGNDSSTSELSALDVSVTGPRRLPLLADMAF